VILRDGRLYENGRRFPTGSKTPPAGRLGMLKFAFALEQGCIRVLRLRAMPRSKGIHKLLYFHPGSFHMSRQSYEKLEPNRAAYCSDGSWRRERKREKLLQMGLAILHARHKNVTISLFHWGLNCCFCCR
jgi:hypothetical protein